MEAESSSREQPSLQLLNVANLLAYCLNVIGTYAVGVFGPSNNAEISEKYQTLVTPAAYAFGIWSVIFTSQLIWTVVQLLPQYRVSDIVVKGVGWGYVIVCISQVFWTIAFAFEKISLSFNAMVSILVPLVIVLSKTSQFPDENKYTYALFKFPFEIHAAWIMAASTVNANVLAVAMDLTASTQIIIAWCSLAALVTVAFYYSYKQLWVVPSVLAWACFAIHVSLSNPRDAIVNTFSMKSIATFEMAAEYLTFLIILVAAGSFVYRRVYVPSTEEQVGDEETNDSLREPLNL